MRIVVKLVPLSLIIENLEVPAVRVRLAVVVKSRGTCA